MTSESHKKNLANVSFISVAPNEIARRGNAPAKNAHATN